MKERFIEAGEIVNTHGVAGEVKIQPWTDSAEFLLRFKTLYMDGKPVKVLASRVHKNMLLALLEGVGNVNAAMVLKGKKLFFDRGDAALPEGDYFLCDLIGAKVTDESGNDIGTLTEVMDAPAGFVYVVRGDAEHLIPAVDEFVKSVDVDAGLITVRLIEGM